MVKIRLGQYTFAYGLFRFLSLFWWNMLRKHICFDKCDGVNYFNEEVDVYYLIRLGSKSAN